MASSIKDDLKHYQLDAFGCFVLEEVGIPLEKVGSLEVERLVDVELEERSSVEG